MDYLREGIHLRGFAQLAPLVAYKNEAFTLFGDLMSSVWADYTRMIFNAQVNVEGPPPQNGGGGGRQAPIPAFAPGGSSTRAGRVSYSGGRSAMGAGAIAAAAAAGGVQGAPAYAGERGEGEAQALPVVEQRVVDHEHEVGRNDPCWCGSGKKFKKCHGS
jgi:preprotein translocase subunit SecA